VLTERSQKLAVATAENHRNGIRKWRLSQNAIAPRSGLRKSVKSPSTCVVSLQNPVRKTWTREERGEDEGDLAHRFRQWAIREHDRPLHKFAARGQRKDYPGRSGRQTVPAFFPRHEHAPLRNRCI